MFYLRILIILNVYISKHFGRDTRDIIRKKETVFWTGIEAYFEIVKTRLGN